jgi:hypothetical protein
MDSAEQLVLIQQELNVYRDFLEKTLTRLKEAGVLNNNPIFVFHQGEIKLGMPLLNRSDKGGNWDITLSTVKEFVQRNLILPEKEEAFKKVYSEKKKHYCVFVLSEFGANFVFLPRLFMGKE